MSVAFPFDEVFYRPANLSGIQDSFDFINVVLISLDSRGRVDWRLDGQWLIEGR